MFSSHHGGSESSSTSTKTHYEDGIPVTVTTVVKTVDGKTTTTTTTTRGGKPPTHQQLEQQQQQQQHQYQQQQQQQQQQQYQQQQQHQQQPQYQQQRQQQQQQQQQSQLEQQMEQMKLQGQQGHQDEDEENKHSHHPYSVHNLFHMIAEEVHPDLHSKRVVDGVKMPLHRLIGQDIEDIVEKLDNRSIIVAKGYKEPLVFHNRDFIKVDEHSTKAPSSVTSSISSLSNYLTSPYKGNELFQHRAIYTWVAKNLIYDTDTFLAKADTPQDAETALRTRKCVCAGYSNLYLALAHAAGIKAYVVHGYGKGFGSSPRDRTVQRDSHTGKPTGHAWNSIEISGNRFLVDSTWGSGHLDPSGRFERSFNPFYFAMKPKVAIYSHLPGDDTNQFISPPFTIDEFLDLPYVKAPYFHKQLLIISPKPRTGEIKVNDGVLDVYVEGRHVEDDDTVFAHVAYDGHPVAEALSQRVGGFGNGRKVWWIHGICPASGEGKLEIFLVKGNNPGPNTITYHVHNSGPGQHVQLTTRFASPLQYAVLHPLHGPKPINTPIRIEVMVFEPDTAPESLIVMRAGSHGEGRLTLPKVSVIDNEVALYEAELTFNKKGDWNVYYDENGKGALGGLAKLSII